jgi:hypothetical protein
MNTLHLSISTGRQSVRLCVVCCYVYNDNRFLQSKSDTGHDIVAGVLNGSGNSVNIILELQIL